MQGNIYVTAVTQLAAQKGNPLSSLLLFILLGVVLYFVLFRPQRRRQQQQARMQGRLRPGQRVMTTAGLLADVVAVEDDAVLLEIAPGVEVRFVKQAIGQVLSDDGDDEDEDEETEKETEHDVPEPPAAAEAAETRDTPRDDMEAKTETLPGADGKEPQDTQLNEGDDRSGKKPSA